VEQVFFGIFSYENHQNVELICNVNAKKLFENIFHTAEKVLKEYDSAQNCMKVPNVVQKCPILTKSGQR